MIYYVLSYHIMLYDKLTYNYIVIDNNNIIS